MNTEALIAAILLGGCVGIFMMCWAMTSFLEKILWELKQIRKNQACACDETEVKQ